MRGRHVSLAVPVYLTALLWCASAMSSRSTEDFTSSLIWAPLYLKSPYVTFMNDFQKPTWRTRHPITKEPEQLRDLRLPRGVPFAVICGACFQRSIVATNLTISVSGHEFQTVPKKRKNNKYEYNVSHNECLMTYLITAPIESDGRVTCTLHRGSHRTVEEISFRAVDAEVSAPPEELEDDKSPPMLELHCPQPEVLPTSDNPVVRVWHEDAHDKGSQVVGSPLSTMRPSLTLSRPKHTRHVACSVYHIAAPHKVYQTRYTVRGTQAVVKKDFRVSGERLELEEDAEELAPRISLPNSVLGIIITAVAVCLLLTVIGLYRFVSAARRR